MKTRTIKVVEGQTLFDIALQEYEQVEGVMLLLEDNPDFDLNTALEPGDELVIREEEPAEDNGITPILTVDLTKLKIKALRDYTCDELQLLTQDQFDTCLIEHFLPTADQAQIEEHLEISQRNSLNRINPIQTGQTTSYRTGDDGDHQAGRLVDFYTLQEANVFGNTNRFTDELGGQDYVEQYLIDHATGLGWRTNTFVTDSWNPAIDAINASTHAGFEDWRMPNINELAQMKDYALEVGWNNVFKPDDDGTVFYYSSTTYIADTLQVFEMVSTGRISILGKSTPRPSFICRNHF